MSKGIKVFNFHKELPEHPNGKYIDRKAIMQYVGHITSCVRKDMTVDTEKAIVAGDNLIAHLGALLPDIVALEKRINALEDFVIDEVGQAALDEFNEVGSNL